jgi:hypothetical protein
MEAVTDRGQVSPTHDTQEPVKAMASEFETSPEQGDPPVSQGGRTKAASPNSPAEEIRDLLRPLMGDRDSRRARLTRVFGGYPGLLDRISLDGETGVFLSLTAPDAPRLWRP